MAVGQVPFSGWNWHPVQITRGDVCKAVGVSLQGIKSTMFIDKDTGKVTLPNGLVVTTELSKSGFEGLPHFSQAAPYDYGTLPFQWYRLKGGQQDGHDLNVNLCFYSEDLVSFHVSTNFHPTDPPRWEDFSLETQSQSKLFHDKLLQETLGRPHKTLSVTGENYPGLDYAVEYSYKWGKVWSGYDGKSGSSSIVVLYGSRLEYAQEDYRKNFQGKNLA